MTDIRARKNKRVLVVDDDPGIREMIEMTLATEGYDVEAVADGESALQAARRAPPDVILLDIKMPLMGGGQFARLYREQAGPRRAPIVVITAAQGADERAKEIGADGYLGKPFPLATLLEVVARHAFAK